MEIEIIHGRSAMPGIQDFRRPKQSVETAPTLAEMMLL